MLRHSDFYKSRLQCRSAELRADLPAEAHDRPWGRTQASASPGLHFRSSAWACPAGTRSRRETAQNTRSLPVLQLAEVDIEVELTGRHWPEVHLHIRNRPYLDQGRVGVHRP